MDHEPAGMRVDYTGTALDGASAGEDPMGLFARWFAAATEDPDVPEANAVALATAAPDTGPSVRMVLLKHVDPERPAFGWYTNLDSRKADELGRGDGRAALAWWWPGSLGVQVRATGRVEPIEAAVALEYFRSRPLASRVSAAVSRQSLPVVARDVLEARAAELRTSTMPDGPVELPARWGGQRLVVDELEFWVGRQGRLHDRIVFVRVDEAGRPVHTSGAVAGAGGEDTFVAAATRVVDPHGTTWLRARLEP